MLSLLLIGRTKSQYKIPVGFCRKSIILVVEVVCLLSFAFQASAQNVIIEGGNVIDVKTGSTRIASIVVFDGIVDRIDPAFVPKSDLKVINARGKWVIPGLIEMHSHTTEPDALQRALALGITSALTIHTGGPMPSEDLSQIPSQPIPRTYVINGRFHASDRRRRPDSVKMLAPTTAEAAANDLDNYRQNGVTRIKIWIDDGTVQRENAVATFSDRILSALVRGARARGMDVNVHALTGDLYRRAIALKPTWIIHPMVTDRLTITDVEAMKAAQLGWTTVMSIVLWRGDPQRYAKMVLADPRLVASLSTESLENLRTQSRMTKNPNAAFLPRLVDHVNEYLANIGRNTALVVQEGILVSVGSDVDAGYGTHTEIELVRDAGLDAATILRAATLGGAIALGVSDQYGSIEKSKVADLVILKSNSLEEITNLRDVETIVKGGYVWSSSELLAR